MKSNTRRIELLDELRGFAILAMIVHHFFLDAGDVLMADWGYTAFNRLCTLQPIFWSIFIIISGICSRLSRNVIKRGAIVLGAGLIITFVTVVIMPKMNMDNSQIYFGILSCLGSCMIITGILMPLIKRTNVYLGMGISAALFAVTYTISSKSLLFGLIKLPDMLYQSNYLMPLGFYNDEFFSADYFAIFPWLFMFIFGSFFGKFAQDGAFPEWAYKKHSRLLSFVGRNSLWFYLGHQVVIYAVLYAFFALTLILA